MACKMQRRNAVVERAKIVNLEALQQILVLSRTRCEQLAREGIIKKKAPGKYDLVASVQAYIRFLREDAKINNRDAANARVRDARARDIEARTAERLGRLVSIALYDEMIQGFAGLVRSEFAGMPSACTRDLVMRRIIEREINARLRRMAEYAATQSVRVGPVRGNDNAERANGTGRMGGSE
jgi:phage terminase Nu1 subunit (DNA packaging protein)